MRPAARLSAFIAEGLRAGHTPDALVTALRAQGWDDKDISLAMADWADVGLGVPVPRPGHRAALRDGVVYAVIFASLFAIAWNTVQFGVGLVDLWIPHGPRDWSISDLRWSVSVLAVTVPVFIGLHIHARRAIRRDPARGGGVLRARLAAVALFLVALVLLGNAVAVVFVALGGEIVPNFLAKAAVVAAVAIGVALYYRLTAPVTD